MNKIKNIGNIGEKIVIKYLKNNNIKLIETNFHSRYGEIDIIAQDSKYIMFIEVKSKKINSTSSALERVNFFKKNKILKTASVYLMQNTIEKQPRFDVAQVILDENFCAKVEYMKNAFDGFYW